MTGRNIEQIINACKKVDKIFNRDFKRCDKHECRICVFFAGDMCVWSYAKAIIKRSQKYTDLKCLP